jgi:HSP20 family molecular chaperone IbpA
VSLDGFRADYLQRGRTPTLDSLARAGVRAEWMTPSFPTKTFPNHYTLVTGLVPDHHGIVANNMWDDALGRFSMSIRDAVRDARWWGGEPVWVTAEKQGRPAAAMFWPGSEAPIGGVYATHWMSFDDGFSRAARVDSVLTWLDVPVWSAGADVQELEDRAVITMEVPGVRPEHLSVSAEHRTLTVKVEREGHGATTRQFTIGSKYELAGVEAKLEYGVLTLSLPKAAEAQARQVPVTVG